MRYLNLDENVYTASGADDANITVPMELWGPSYPFTMTLNSDHSLSSLIETQHSKKS